MKATSALVAAQMREFVSLSDKFEVVRTQTPSGVDVELYHFPSPRWA